MKIKRSKLNKLIESLLLEEEEGAIDKEDPVEMLKALTGPSDSEADALYISLKTVFDNESVIAAESIFKRLSGNSKYPEVRELFDQIVDTKLNIFNALTLSLPNKNQAKLELTELKRLVDKLPDKIEGATVNYKENKMSPKEVLKQAVDEVFKTFQNPKKAQKSIFEKYQDIATSYKGFSISQYFNKMKDAKVRDFNFPALVDAASRAFISAGRSFKSGDDDAKLVTISRLKVVHYCVKEFPEDKDNDKKKALGVISELIMTAGGILPSDDSNDAQKNSQKVDQALSQENADEVIDNVDIDAKDKEVVKSVIKSDKKAATKKSKKTQTAEKVKEIQRIIGSEQTGTWKSGDPVTSPTQAAWESWLGSQQAEAMMRALARDKGFDLNEAIDIDAYISTSLRSKKLRYILEKAVPGSGKEPRQSAQTMSDEDLKELMNASKKDAREIAAKFGYTGNADGIMRMLQDAENALANATVSDQTGASKQQQKEPQESDKPAKKTLKGKAFEYKIKTKNHNIELRGAFKDNKPVVNAVNSQFQSALKELLKKNGAKNFNFNQNYYVKLALINEILRTITKNYDAFMEENSRGKTVDGYYIVATSLKRDNNNIVKYIAVKSQLDLLEDNLNAKTKITAITGGVAAGEDIRQKLVKLHKAYKQQKDYSSRDLQNLTW